MLESTIRRGRVTPQRFVAVTAIVIGLTGTVLTGTAFATSDKSGKDLPAAAQSNGKAKGHGTAVATPTTAAAKASTNSGSTVTPTGCPNTFHHVNTGNGANTSGAYDSTCDGSPSLNGKSDNDNTGKPCAGCVGNADFKNPKGQAPDGSDHNKGYECDKNQGIGKGNPAHSGCKTTPSDVTTTTVKKDTTTTTVKTDVSPTTIVKDNVTTTTKKPEVLGESITKEPTTEAGALAMTGSSNTAKLLTIGLILMLIGSSVLGFLRMRKLNETA